MCDRDVRDFKRRKRRSSVSSSRGAIATWGSTIVCERLPRANALAMTYKREESYQHCCPSHPLCLFSPFCPSIKQKERMDCTTHSLFWLIGRERPLITRNYQMITRSSTGIYIASPSLTSNASYHVWMLRNVAFTRLRPSE